MAQVSNLEKVDWKFFKLSYLAAWLPLPVRRRLLCPLLVQGADSVSGNCASMLCLSMSGRLFVGLWVTFFLLKIFWLSCMCADCFHLQLVENSKHISRWDNKALTAETNPEGPTVCVCVGFFPHETSNKRVDGSRLCLCKKKQQQKNVLVVCSAWSWNFWWLGSRVIFCLQSNVRGARSWVGARAWRRSTPIQQYIIGWEPSALPHRRMLLIYVSVSFPIYNADNAGSSLTRSIIYILGQF